jgi:uncharacterized protein YkwD
VALALWGGYMRGFIQGSVDLLLLLGSLAAAIHFYPYALVLFNRYITGQSVWARPLAFLSVLIFTRLLLSLLVNLLLRDVSAKVHYSAFNRFFGLIPGLVNGVIYAAIFSALFLAVPVSEGLTNKTRDSQIAPKLALQVEWLENKLGPVFNDAVNRSFNKMTIDPGSKTTIDLQFTVTDPTVRPDLEEQMLILINAERMKRKLRALIADPSLVPVARAHSIDMFARGYFSHQTPEGLTPADRVKKARVPYMIMGENLALGQTLSICHRGLMNSPGHKANILSTAYGRVGIGIVDGGVHGLMVTQEFRN